MDPQDVAAGWTAINYEQEDASASATLSNGERPTEQKKTQDIKKSEKKTKRESQDTNSPKNEEDSFSEDQNENCENLAGKGEKESADGNETNPKNTNEIDKKKKYQKNVFSKKSMLNNQKENNKEYAGNGESTCNKENLGNKNGTDTEGKSSKKNNAENENKSDNKNSTDDTANKENASNSDDKENTDKEITGNKEIADKKETVDHKESTSKFDFSVREEGCSKVAKRKESKSGKRDMKHLQDLLKTLEESQRQRLEGFISKYNNISTENKALEVKLAGCERHCTELIKERDQLKLAQGRTLLGKTKLESLCRELQRQNKKIKEENTAKIRDEEEKRKEVTAKFQTTLSEVSNMMADNNEKNIKLREYNADMAQKLSQLCTQFEQREEQITRLKSQMDLEKQLYEAQLQKCQYELKAEKEVWITEKENLQKNLSASEETIQKLTANIENLEKHLKLYTEKYQEFENTIAKSNNVFDTCKQEMEKMSKNTGELEKEVLVWKNKWQKCVQSLLELAASKKVTDTELQNAQKKVDQLQKLCRQLQVDRSSYIKQLKAHGIEPQSQVCSDNVPKQANDLRVLKDQLKAIKDQIDEVSKKTEKNNSDSDSSVEAIDEMQNGGHVD